MFNQEGDTYTVKLVGYVSTCSIETLNLLSGAKLSKAAELAEDYTLDLNNLPTKELEKLINSSGSIFVEILCNDKELVYNRKVVDTDYDIILETVRPNGELASYKVGGHHDADQAMLYCYDRLDSDFIKYGHINLPKDIDNGVFKLIKCSKTKNSIKHTLIASVDLERDE